MDEPPPTPTAQVYSTASPYLLRHDPINRTTGLLLALQHQPNTSSSSSAAAFLKHNIIISFLDPTSPTTEWHNLDNTSTSLTHHLASTEFAPGTTYRIKWTSYTPPTSCIDLKVHLTTERRPATLIGPGTPGMETMVGLVLRDYTWQNPMASTGVVFAPEMGKGKREAWEACAGEVVEALGMRVLEMMDAGLGSVVVGE